MTVYKCNECSKLFTNKTDFKRHKNRKTPCNSADVIVKKFTCSKCYKSYTTKGSLMRHINNSGHVKGDRITKTLQNVSKIEISSPKVLICSISSFDEPTDAAPIPQQAAIKVAVF